MTIYNPKSGNDTEPLYARDPNPAASYRNFVTKPNKQRMGFTRNNKNRSSCWGGGRSERPSLIIVLTYAAVFMMGIAIGFVPFLKVYIDNCEVNQSILNNMIEYMKTTNQSTTFFKSGAQYGKSLWVDTKIGFGRGNSDIELQCVGAIIIRNIEYSGVSANSETRRKFVEFCKSHAERSFSLLRCIVSLKRVYGVPYDTDSITQISYTCDPESKSKKQK